MAKRLKVKDTRPKRGQTTTAKDEDTDLHVKESGLFCELCDYQLDKRVKCKAFCDQCNSFLCKQCIDKHNKVQELKAHSLLHGSRMPKGLYDKPVKYPDFAIHVENICDCYCLHHRTLVCRQCTKDYHDTCNSQFVPLLCRNLGHREVDEFNELFRKAMSSIKMVRSVLEENISKIEEQRSQMIQEANMLRDNLIEKINKALDVTTENINAFCKEKCAEITERMSNLSETIKEYEAKLADITDSENENIVPSNFLRFQTIGKQADLRTKKLIEQSRTTDLGFLSIFEHPLSGLSEEWMKRLGSVKEDTNDITESVEYSNVRFPVLTDFDSDIESNGNTKTIARIKVAKKMSVNIGVREDHQTYDIRGMSATASGNLLILDNANSCVRIVSPCSSPLPSINAESAENIELASLVIPAQLNYVAVVDDKKAVVATTQMKGMSTYDWDHIHILDISNESEITVLRSMKGFCRGVCPYKNYLILATDYHPQGLKMIDYSDPELQSVVGARMIWPTRNVLSSFNRHPCGIVRQHKGRGSTFVVNYMFSIETLNANDGTVINTANLETIGTHTKAYVSCLTTDENGNVYGFVRPSNEVRVWSPDLQQSRTLLTNRDLASDPVSMVYNDQTEELLVGYREMDFIDRFQLIL